MKVSSLRIVVALAASALTAFASVAAAAPAPRVVSANGYRPASGPARGTIVVTARVSYRGVVRAADLRVRDASGTPLATGAVTLTAGGRTVIARDTVRLQPYAHRGRTAYFYFRFPASMARLLPRTGTLRPAFHFGVAGGRLQKATSAKRENGFGIGCTWWMVCTPTIYQQPPDPPIGLAQSIGASTATMCIQFGGAGYGSPAVTNAQILGPQANASNEFIFAAGMPSVAADGSFSGPGGEQGPNGAGTQPITLSGVVNPSLLTSPPGASTGPSSLSYSGPEWLGYPQAFTEILPFAEGSC